MGLIMREENGDSNLHDISSGFSSILTLRMNQSLEKDNRATNLDYECYV